MSKGLALSRYSWVVPVLEMLHTQSTSYFLLRRPQYRILDSEAGEMVKDMTGSREFVDGYCMDIQILLVCVWRGRNPQIEYYMETRINTRFFAKVILNL